MEHLVGPREVPFYTLVVRCDQIPPNLCAVGRNEIRHVYGQVDPAFESIVEFIAAVRREETHALEIFDHS